MGRTTLEGDIRKVLQLHGLAVEHCAQLVGVEEAVTLRRYEGVAATAKLRQTDRLRKCDGSRDDDRAGSRTAGEVSVILSPLESCAVPPATP
jgi:hypothetical protein